MPRKYALVNRYPIHVRRKIVLIFRFIGQFEQDAMDVNAVGFIDETSNIIYSGSDNGVIKVQFTVPKSVKRIDQLFQLIDDTVSF